MASEHEELSIGIRGSKRIMGALITVLLSTTGAGGVTYAIGSADREKAEVSRRLAEQEAKAADTELTVLRERVCVLERELTAEVSARVSLSAADAEPSKARKAQTAKRAVDQFDETADGWACPSTPQDREKRTQRPLWKRAANALPGTVPERR
jgi:hypothetical protein